MYNECDGSMTIEKGQKGNGKETSLGIMKTPLHLCNAPVPPVPYRL